MVHSFRVSKLNGDRSFTCKFNDRLNILTGKNGSGKTTILKMLWYMVSPNLERLTEILFDSATINTDAFSLTVSCSNQKIVSIHFKNLHHPDITFDFEQEKEFNPFSSIHDPVETVNRLIQDTDTCSLFFPTFRRIEGGFSLDTRRYEDIGERRATSFQQAVSRYADRISVNNHLFVSSVSTEDIDSLIRNKAYDLSAQTDKLHIALSKFIQEAIAKQGKTHERSAALIQQIKERVLQAEKKRRTIMTPITILSNLICSIFKDKGIIFSPTLTLGDPAHALLSRNLSAGEKQMLSFLCYNTFFDNAPIFIDEPELSLHVDWQRSLFRYLLDQKSNNQFIVSTHSPFIYAKYPECEIILDEDRGDSGDCR